MNFSVSEELHELYADAALGILRYSAAVCDSKADLLALLEGAIARLRESYTMESVARSKQIAATRNAYRALGKSPHEYRNAAEAMLRRIVKGNGLYHINSIVETNNLVSVSSGYSIGSYDAGRVSGDITLRRAPDGASYEGIGKGAVNIAHLPTLYDDNGAFGNPTSDSRRAMVQPDTNDIVSVLYAFDGGADLPEWMVHYKNLLKTYCGVRSVEGFIVRCSEKTELFAE